MPTCAIVSFRLGLSDGVSVVARSWQHALTELGFDVLTVAGEGPVDRLLPGLAIAAPEPPTRRELDDAFADADLVVVENLCTIPLNLPAARELSRLLAGRPAVLHHHDPPWQMPQHSHVTELPPDDAAWRHVTINALTQREFSSRGIRATLVYNAFDPKPAEGNREATRAALAVHDDERLFIHPVRAIPRKNIPAAVRLSEELHATYWLLGQAENGYDDELAAVLGRARCRVIHAASPGDMSDAYAAADAVVFPSTWEGFGNPPVEAALLRKPAAVGHYAVAEELRAFGFRFFDPDRPHDLDRFLHTPDAELLDHNQRIAREHFSHERMAADLEALLDDAGWRP